MRKICLLTCHHRDQQLPQRLHPQLRRQVQLLAGAQCAAAWEDRGIWGSRVWLYRIRVMQSSSMAGVHQPIDCSTCQQAQLSTTMALLHTSCVSTLQN